MSYLSFTAPERRALGALLVIILTGCGVLIWKRVYTRSASGYRIQIVTDSTDAPTPVLSATAAKLHRGINPNTAPPEDLELLPGIGPGLARRIVAARTADTAFRKPADLLAVPGIGPAKLADLTPYLSFP